MNIFDLFKSVGIYDGIDEIFPEDCKFHFAKSKNAEMKGDFLTRTDFKRFQENQSNRNFNLRYIVSFYKHNTSWIFAGIWISNGCVENDQGGFTYKTKFVESSAILERRLVVTWTDRFRNSYPKGDTLKNDLEILSIHEKPDDLGQFPGYASISLSLRKVSQIVNEADRFHIWRSALSNVSGVYVITDHATGKLYVGSAYGDDGIWQRWTCYAKTKHGNNKELKMLKKEKGEEYFEDFTFSLLWYGGTGSSQEEVFKQECFWKDALGTRNHGYNSN